MTGGFLAKDTTREMVRIHFKVENETKSLASWSDKGFISTGLEGHLKLHSQSLLTIDGK